MIFKKFDLSINNFRPSLIYYEEKKVSGLGGVGMRMGLFGPPRRWEGLVLLTAGVLIIILAMPVLFWAIAGGVLAYLGFLMQRPR